MDILFGKEPSAYSESLVTRYFYPFGFGTLALGMVCAGNFAVRRPVWTGIHKHVIATSLGVMFGEWGYHYRQGLYAERDAVLKHYIELHPEDFPPVEKLKYKDILDSWTPVR